MVFAPITYYSWIVPQSSFPYPVILRGVGHYNRQPKHQINKEYFSIIHWIDKGKGIYNVNGETMTVSEGQCFLFRPGVVCSYKAFDKKTPFSTSWVSFVGGEDLFEYYNVPQYKLFNLTNQVKSGHNYLLNVCKSHNSVAQYSAACYSFLIDVLESLTQTDLGTLDIIKNFLNENYNKNIALNDVLDKINMTKQSLSVYLKKENEPSVMTQLRQIRILKAKQFIKNTNHSISEIGKLCGFESPSYFGKIFKEETGSTPLKYRENYKNAKK